MEEKAKATHVVLPVIASITSEACVNPGSRACHVCLSYYRRLVESLLWTHFLISLIESERNYADVVIAFNLAQQKLWNSFRVKNKFSHLCLSQETAAGFLSADFRDIEVISVHACVGSVRDDWHLLDSCWRIFYFPGTASTEVFIKIAGSSSSAKALLVIAVDRHSYLNKKKPSHW